MHDSVAVLYMMTFAQIPFELWVGEGSKVLVVRWGHVTTTRPTLLPHQRQLQLPWRLGVFVQACGISCLRTCGRL